MYTLPPKSASWAGQLLGPMCTSISKQQARSAHVDFCNQTLCGQLDSCVIYNQITNSVILEVLLHVSCSSLWSVEIYSELSED